MVMKRTETLKVLYYQLRYEDDDDEILDKCKITSDTLLV